MKMRTWPESKTQNKKTSYPPPSSQVLQEPSRKLPWPQLHLLLLTTSNPHPPYPPSSSPPSSPPLLPTPFSLRMPSIMKVIPFLPSKSKKKKKEDKLAKDQSNPSSFSSTTSFSSAGTPKTVLLPPSSPPSTIADSSSLANRNGAADFDIEEVFKIFDRDNDGKITLAELELLFHRLALGQPSQDELLTMLNEADLDGDGCISLEEFGVLSSALGPAHGTELRDAFDYFDTDGDGKISAEELREVFLALGDEECTLDDCRRMIGGVDVEGKGFVGYDDFVRMMDGRR